MPPAPLYLQTIRRYTNPILFIIIITIAVDGICPIAEFPSPYWIVRIVTEYRILFSVHVVMYMYCLKILSEYWKVTKLFKPLPRYRNF